MHDKRCPCAWIFPRGVRIDLLQHRVDPRFCLLGEQPRIDHRPSQANKVGELGRFMVGLAARFAYVMRSLTRRPSAPMPPKRQGSPAETLDKPVNFWARRQHSWRSAVESPVQVELTVIDGSKQQPCQRILLGDLSRSGSRGRNHRGRGGSRCCPVCNR